MEPGGRETGVGWETVEVVRAELKALKDLLDYAFDVMKVDEPSGVERT